MPQYEPTSIYDAPSQVLGMAMDGELTIPGVRAALLDPARLTPKERETPLSRLKEQAGGNPITNTLIDVASNPWVWFAVLTTPVGVSALRGAGRTIFDIAPRFRADVSKFGSMLSAIGLTSPSQDFRGTGTFEFADQINRTLRRLSEDTKKVIQGPYERLLEEADLPHLDWKSIADPVKRQKARDIVLMAYAKNAGFHRSWQETQAFIKDGDAVAEAIQHGQKLARHPDDVLRELVGGSDAAVEWSKALRARMNLLADETYRTVEDQLRVWRLHKNPAIRASIDENAQGKSIIDFVFGEGLEGIKDGKLSKQRFLDMVELVNRAPLNNEYYVPRNTFESFIGENSIEDALRSGQARQYGLVKPGGFTIARVKGKGVMLHPDDLERIGELGGKLETLDADIQAGRQAMMASAQKGEAIKFLRADFQEATGKYVEQAARTRALTQLADPETLMAQQRAIRSAPEGRKHGTPLLPAEYDEGFGGRVSYSVPAAEFGEGQGPLGGVSVADVMAERWTALQNETARRRFTDQIIPQMLGRSTLKRTALTGAIIRSKEIGQGIAESDVGKAISEHSKLGKEWVEKLKGWASSPTYPSAGRVASGEAASWLYASHMGLPNVASPLFNLMQPALLASSWLGAGNVAKAYGTAIGEMLGYLGERLPLGAHVDDVTRLALMRKHFSLTRYGSRMEDLIGIVGHLEDDIGRSVMTGRPEARGFRKFLLEDSMALFQNTETLNRLVTGHAVLNAYRGSGRAVTNAVGELLPEVASDVRQMVQETQFGGGLMNTPWVFMDGPLSNPLLKQFLQFPLRTMTGLLETGGRIGGREGAARYLGPAIDLGRMMGVSAIVYETGKDLLHADLSRSLAFSAVTDLVPGFQGGRFDERGDAIPIPPAIQIPADLIKATGAGDIELFRRTIPRLIPGGLGLSKVLGAAPSLPFPLHTLQKEYVDWGKMQDGPDGATIVPVMKGDGTLVRWDSPAGVVLKGIGLATGQDTATKDFEGYLLKQADVVRDYRSRAIKAMLGGDMDAYQNFVDEFTKRTGLPMVITAQQLAQARRSRDMTLAEKAMRRLPQYVQQGYAPFVGEAASRAAGLTPDQFTREGFNRKPTVLPPAAETPPTEGGFSQGSGAFASFESF